MRFAGGRGRLLTGVLVAALAAVGLGVTSLATSASAASAPGAPGIASSWTSGAKDGLGTATSSASRVWFTLGNGITDEVYYPQTDTPDVQDLQYLITDGSTFTESERDSTTHQVSLADPRSLTYQQVNTARSGRYRITKTYVTDPARSTLLIRTRFEVLTGGPLQLYVLYNPSLNNSGLGDSGATESGQLRAGDGPVASALAASTGFTAASSGYSGTSSDGWQDLMAHHTLTAQYDAATPGNLVQAAQIPVGNDSSFTLALGFGATRGEAGDAASASLVSGWDTVVGQYQSGWHDYLAGLTPPPGSVSSGNLGQLFETAVMTLKAHEDKLHPGAFVASLTIPWGQAVNADNCCTAGYHAVWARDLYEIATALIAVGDRAAANRALDYLFTVQERPDGSYPQNTRLDGTPVFGSLQMDEVAFPIVLAWQLGRFDAASWAKVRASAGFLVGHGPATPQERWEEAGGYSPATIAAEIAGLVCAADIATRNGDSAAAANYVATADAWQRSVDTWTYTTSGHLSGGSYYERIDNNGNPNDGATLTIANGGGSWDERDVVDAGFLELVRLGIKPATDSHITRSLATVDATIRTATPFGDMWHRYNHDGYGETSTGAPFTGTGIGRDWPLLSGERGEWALAAGQPATAYLATMAGSADSGGMIPEQAWDTADAYGFQLGKGTGSAMPLAWAMAQYVRLAVSISAGHPVETPSVVAARYLGTPATVTQTVTVAVPGSTDGTGAKVYLAGTLSALGTGSPAQDWNAAGLPLTRVDGTHWTATLTGPPGASVQYKYTLGDWTRVEKDAGCGEISNRSVSLPAGGTASRTDAVLNWRNVTPCGN